MLGAQFGAGHRHRAVQGRRVVNNDSVRFAGDVVCRQGVTVILLTGQIVEARPGIDILIAGKGCRNRHCMKRRLIAQGGRGD